MALTHVCRWSKEDKNGFQCRFRKPSRCFPIRRFRLTPDYSCVTSANRKNNSLEQDAELLKRLKSYTGDELPVPHELAYIYQCFSNRPGIQGWLALCQRKGFISEKSFSLLKEQLV